MCGIAGIVGRTDAEELRRMAEVMQHRGPDGDGHWLSPRRDAGFGHRRLKIIDLSDAARQPMTALRERYVITYNGEIFNYRELRAELASRGWEFSSASDTEVLLKGYIEWGAAVLDRLIGQFAFAIWDDEERRLFAARDHLGIKPFYYATDGGRLLFASEAKSLLAVLPACRAVHWEMLPLYLSFLWVPGRDTLYAGISKLEPGQWLRFERGTVTTGEYWSPLGALGRQEGATESLQTRAEHFRDLLEEAVRSQLVSDVPLGLLLSGGLDSTAMLALMSRHTQEPQALTATYAPDSRSGDVFEDDLAYARRAASRYHARLTERRLDPDVAELLPRVLWQLDEPLGDPTVIVNYALTRAARPQLTVLLSGMGADEILAGYPRYPATLLGESLRGFPGRAFSGSAALLSDLVRRRLLPVEHTRRPVFLLEHMGGDFERRFIGYSSYFSREQLGELLLPDAAERIRPARAEEWMRTALDRVSGLTPLRRMLAVDLRAFLPCLNLENMDKTSMANSVEMRVPFLDRRVVEFALATPDTDKLRRFTRKRLLREAFRHDVPAEILRRRKTGYSPPVRAWVRGSLREHIEGTLLSERCLGRGIWNSSAIRTLLRENREGLHDHAMKLWLLYVFEVWMRSCIETSDAPRTP